MLIFERHTGCLLSVRLRPGKASSHARILLMLARLIPLAGPFPGIQIKLRGDAGFARRPVPSISQLCAGRAGGSVHGALEQKCSWFGGIAGAVANAGTRCPSRLGPFFRTVIRP